MLPMPAQIEIYQRMSALSAQMVEAARANNWEQLVALEKSVAALRDILMVEEDNSTISPREADLKRALIQRVLDDDAEIRRYTEPRMEVVRRFLGDAAKRKQLERAYGVR